MKINANVDVIERGGVSEGRSYSVQFNEKLARMLSKGIYQNVIRAPVRELACNALDSHRAAGKLHVPIRVHLPNSLEPYFEVQDEGLGLSDDGIYTLFTCYGGSDKDHSNEDIGGFGLGSKSPFAYTNSFTVSCVWQGVKRHYAMHKDEKGKPHVTPLGEEMSSEPNGVTVRVPVKPADFNAFRENAQETYRWFEHPPTVVGNNRYKLPDVKYMEGFGGDMWKMLDSQMDDYYHRASEAVVVMANVCYPLRSDSLKDKFKRLTEYSLVIRFNNGELEPAVSREDLNYDESTVQVLEARLTLILEQLKNGVENTIATAPTLWQANIALVQMLKNRTTHEIINTLARSGYTPKWNGHDLSTHGVMHWLNEFSKESPAPNVTLVSQNYRARNVSDVRIGNATVFVLKDCHDATSRCRKAYYKNGAGNKYVYLIEGTSLQDDGSVIWNATKCANVEKWRKLMGDPEIILASSLDKLEKVSMKFKGRAWTGYSSRSWGRTNKSNNWDKEIDLTTSLGGYYVTVDGLTPWHKDVGEIKMGVIYDQAKELGILTATDTVWGVNKTNTKLIVGNPAWKEIHGHVKQAVEKLILTHNMAESVHNLTQSNEASHRLWGSAAEWNKKMGHMMNTLGVYVREWSRMTQAATKQINTDSLSSLARAVGVPVVQNSTQQLVDLSGLWKQVTSEYPLIKYAARMSPTNNADFDEFVDYVKLIDATKK